MTPLFIKLNGGLELMVIPDTTAHLDGHTILTYTYSIFRDIGAGNPLLSRSKESTLHLEQIDDPEYYGFITFEKPGKLFSYTADGQRELESYQVNELIEHLSDIRDNPASWNQLQDNKD
ncbi:hypothetical protein MTO98_30850 [Mucilaginibacter sp. SMC90]|uniref:hypothetical protein n=1 Tax=Mucilaginibacter sp. SMC90 TaxID=2929803 RepID=UPI001FB4418E|nr:hypothetical protein [Mucilaginibacter sp. SMC90]UOE48801.1 hypothetical protein MTO98_30850 [Mucilaginibacter sp. SMC90]